MGRKIAVVGASEDASKYGYKIFTTLLKSGEEVYGVNPKGGTVEGRKIYASLSDIPARPDVVIMVVPPLQTRPVVEEAIKLKIPEIWFQPGTQHPKSVALARANAIEAIEDCFMARGGYW